ncbi:MAG: hypothetical protein AAFP20_04125 [Cyanobacteria bacterium J06614_10]
MPHPKATPFRQVLKTVAIRSLPLVGLSLILLPLESGWQRAIAHQVEVMEDVGATLHIEPDDTPLAGEESLAWFALTRRGGEVIPLSACDCQLTVSSESAAAEPLTPALSPVDAEGYEDIPGAQFTFPEVGLYTLTLTGEPVEAGDFSPFTFEFETTVAAGSAVPTIPENDAAALPAPQDGTEPATTEDFATRQRGLLPVLILLAAGGLCLVLALNIFRRNRQKP